MADEQPRSFTESEMHTLVADRVQRETADLTTAKTTLETEKAELEGKLDVSEAAKKAAETRADEAEKALADYKTSIEQEREAAARKDDRLKQVREAAAHLGDDFLTDETRVARIVGYDDDAFAGYVADLAATKPDGSTTTTTSTVPRETAMSGQSAGGDKPASAASNFLLRGYTPKEG